jgi:hypothetical protein
MKRALFILAWVAVAGARCLGGMLGAFAVSGWGFLQLALVALKATGSVSWPWWAVFLPLIIATLAALVAGVMHVRFVRMCRKYTRTYL